MDTSLLFVSVSYVFHLIATVVWLGWSLLLVTTRSSHQEESDLHRLVQRTMPLALLAFAGLAVTGLYQMATDSHYEDVLTFDTAWSRLLLLKHLAFLGEALVLGAIRFVLVPDLRFQRRAAARGRDAGVEQTQRRYRWAAWINLALGGVILVLTGVITALP